MKSNLRFLVLALALCVLAFALYWKGDVSAKITGPGVSVSIEAKDKKTSEAK